MEKILLTDILDLEHPNLYKLHAAKWNGTNRPLDVFVNSYTDWLGWNTWRESKDEFNRKYILSLIRYYHETDSWLFGGIFEVLGSNNTPYSHCYEIKEIKRYSKYIGRLKVKAVLKSRTVRLKLENWINKIEVVEILKQPYKGEEFPGYENINHDFDILKPIFKYENPGWKTALKNIKGVYLITDKKNGKKYIGSAYGDDGIWSRWSCYMGTGHGWNDELVEIIKREGFEYAMKNFRISLLEYRSMKTDDNAITEREVFWKEALLTRDFGYNKN